MQLTDETGHRALAYVATVNRHRHAPTLAEFNAYIDAPLRKRTGARFVEDAFFAQFRRTQRALAEVMGTTTTESVIDWLTRLHWLQTRDEGIYITALGNAVLAAMDEAGMQEELPVDILLDPTDELSYPRLIGVIAQAGVCALVDPYFRIDSLLDIVQRTGVERILIKPAQRSDDTGRIAALQQALSSLSFERSFEVRADDSFHDRFLIPKQGPVRFIGTSLSGVGKRISVTAELSEGPPSDAIRRAFEKAWKAAELVGPQPTPEPQQDDANTEPVA